VFGEGVFVISILVTYYDKYVKLSPVWTEKPHTTGVRCVPVLRATVVSLLPAVMLCIADPVPEVSLCRLWGCDYLYTTKCSSR
jgi:hypothetical protein